MLSEEEFKHRFKHKLRALVNDWFFNKERGDKVIQDNYELYLRLTPALPLNPEEMAKQEFISWHRKGFQC